MSKKFCDILSLEIYSSGRDIDIVEPLLCYLEKYYKLTIVREKIFNFSYCMIKFRPKVLIVSNSIGSYYKFAAVKLAHFLGIKVLTLVSEGGTSNRITDKDYKKEINNIFGLNRDHIIYEDINCLWNSNDFDLASKFISPSKLKIIGATLFDKYKILPNINKKIFLKKYNKEKYHKIILITAWTFSALSEKSAFWWINKESIIYNLGGMKYIEMHRKNGNILRDIYSEIIDCYKDVLFIIKEHPGEKDCNSYVDTEYYMLDKKENVLFIKGYEESMFNLLSVSDILLTYESTSTLEAWLSGVVSININPLGEFFPRLPFYKGAIVAKSFEQVKGYINEFYSNNRQINDFNLKEDIRKEIIKNFIYNDDGKNYVRAANEVLKLLNNGENKKSNVNLWVIKEILKGYIKKFLENYYKKRVNDVYSYEERENWHKIYYKNINK